MRYRNLGKDLKVSPLGFGMMRLPCEDNAPFSTKVLADESVKMLRHAIDNGLNYVDTAYPYHGGVSEEVTGRALGDGYRNKVTLATKSPIFLIDEPGGYTRKLDEQLKRLKTDHIDLYMFHAVDGSRWDDKILKYDMISEAEKAKKAGKIGKIGFSFHDTYENFVKITDGYDAWAFCQIQFNYLDTENQAGIAGLRYATARNIPVIVMEPLLGGKLAQLPPKVAKLFEAYPDRRSPVEWALDWLWDMPEVSVVLSGMSSMAQTVENMGYAERAAEGMLSPSDRDLIERVTACFKAFKGIDCTRCAYCMPCPHGVDIPGNFGAYNTGVMFENPMFGKQEYAILKVLGPNGHAASCTRCGACEPKCPQKLEIVSLLETVRAACDEANA